MRFFLLLKFSKPKIRGEQLGRTKVIAAHESLCIMMRAPACVLTWRVLQRLNGRKILQHSLAQWRAVIRTAKMLQTLHPGGVLCPALLLIFTACTPL